MPEQAKRANVTDETFYTRADIHPVAHLHQYGVHLHRNLCVWFVPAVPVTPRPVLQVLSIHRLPVKRGIRQYRLGVFDFNTCRLYMFDCPARTPLYLTLEEEPD